LHTENIKLDCLLSLRLITVRLTTIIIGIYLHTQLLLNKRIYKIVRNMKKEQSLRIHYYVYLQSTFDNDLIYYGIHMSHIASIKSNDILKLNMCIRGIIFIHYYS